MNAKTETDMAAATPAPQAQPTPAADPAPKPGASRGRRMLMLALPLALVLGGTAWWLSGGRYETTENAYLHHARIAVAADLSGRVVSVNIADNAVVTAGDVLFTVDPEPYRLALAQADAALAGARLQVEQLKAAYRVALARQKAAEDDVAYQQAELARQKALTGRGVATSSALDGAEHNASKAAEALAQARQEVSAARAALGGDPEIATADHPTVRAAQVARDTAAYRLGLTEVRAPLSGTVYQASSFRAGQFVTAGAPLFALVDTGSAWVEANFKETQLDGLAPGQSADITFDIDPGKSYRAHVAAIGAGTGSEFSLIPAQNATGNWVKVTQRVPVRLELDDAGAGALPSGLSAHVTVDTGRTTVLAGLVAGVAQAAGAEGDK